MLIDGTLIRFFNAIKKKNRIEKFNLLINVYWIEQVDLGFPNTHF